MLRSEKKKNTKQKIDLQIYSFRAQSAGSEKYPD